MIASKDIYALIIGINNYWERPKLLGAVNDAKQFEEHLKANGVPSTNITKLFDDHATRVAIISELKYLARNTNIEKDKSAIIIFFAGHGASSPAPPDWPEWATVGGQVEQLCSVDIQSTPGKVIEGIPDHMIRLLLDEIAAEKGNNITMFLDCCHAAGMNRDADGPQSSDLIQRSIDDPPPLSSLWSLSRSDSEAGELQNGERLLGALAARDSHVQVAACSSNQKAHESSGHGLFTTALLKVLRAHPFGTLTYRSLMHRLALGNTPETAQTPLCDGTFIRRRLFDSTSPEADPALILCKYDRVRKQFTLMAGSLLGITVDSEYKIFDTDLPDVKSSESALTAIVHSVQPYRSTLSPLPPANGQSPGPPIHEIYYARLFKTASTALCLYCWDERYLADVLKNYKDEKRPFIPLVQVYQPEAADFLLKLNDETVFFERGSKTVIVAPDTGLPALLSHHESRKNISSVRGVLDSYAWFLQYLRLTWSIQDGEDPVRLSFKRLQMTSSGKIEPASKEMLESEINDATVHVDETQFYGLTVKNITRVPLFVYIFSFCPHEFKISLFYEPQSDNGNSYESGDALEPGKTLFLGYGYGATRPLQFTRKTVTLLKIFVSARAMNDGLRSLEQDSPFKISRDINKLATWHKPQVEAEKDNAYSMTKTITVVEGANRRAL